MENTMSKKLEELASTKHKGKPSHKKKPDREQSEGIQFKLWPRDQLSISVSRAPTHSLKFATLKLP